MITDLDTIAGKAVKSRLYPEPPVIKTEITVSPQEVHREGVLKFEVAPGSKGVVRSITIYKYKPVVHIKMDTYRFCKFEGNVCKIKPKYVFNYQIQGTSKWTPEVYYAVVGGPSGRAYVPFRILEDKN